MQLETVSGICKHVKHARDKHVWPKGASNWYKSRVLLSEVGELLWAVFVERDKERIREEALDVVAVLVRWIELDGK